MVVFHIVLVMLSIASYDPFTYIIQASFTGTGGNHVIAPVPVKEPWRICTKLVLTQLQWNIYQSLDYVYKFLDVL